MRNQLRASWLGVILAVTLTFAGCYPFQGDVSLLLTPVPIDPAQQAEIAAALAGTQAEAAATPVSAEATPVSAEATPVSAEATPVSAEATPVSAEATPVSMASEGEMAALTATVVSNSLRVRQDVDVNSPIVAGLRRGESVQVVGRTEDGTRLQVQVPDVGTLGWVSAEFVTVEGDVMTLAVPGAEMAEKPVAAEAAAAPAASAETAMAMAGMTLNVDPVTLQIVDGVLTVPSITSSSAGWLVVHADDGGTFGPVIGYAAIAEGENTDVVIPVDTAAATETVHLMLHEDGGVVGTYEFPGADAPVMAEGAPVSMAYAVGAPVVSAGAAAAVPAPAAAAPAPAAAAPAPAAAAPAPAAAAPAPAAAAPAPAAAAPAPVPAAAAPAPAGSGSAAMSAGEAAAMTGMTSAELATVNTRSLRVRSAPAADAEVVGGALNGDIFPVAEKSADGKWVRLYFPGIEGETWVGSEFVSVSAADLNVKYGNVTVNTGGARLRVRTLPSLEGTIVGHVYNGETRMAVGVSTDGQWVLLFLPGVAGPAWASAEFVTYQ